MVLSNKKLKQKIRAKLAESLATSEAQNQPSFNKKPKENLHNLQAHQSLKSILDSATQKPRLSKREKRRVQIIPLQEHKVVVAKSEDSNPKKKRKRGKDEGENIVQEVNGVKDLNKKRSNTKKKKKKNKKHKKGKKEEGVENSLGGTGSDEQAVAETIKNPSSKEEVGISTKVYVGGIPYYSTVDDIQSYFEGCGTITEVDCLKFPETGKFNGIAMISFKTEAAAKRALALDGSDMGGLSLKIQPYKATRDKKASDFSPAIVDGYNRIYIGNLSWDTTEDELKKLFSDCSISSIRLGKDKETGEFRGYAHVDFADILSLSMALKLDEKIVCGRPVRIRCAVPPKVVKTNLKALPTHKKGDNIFKAVPISKKDDDFKVVPISKKADAFTSEPITSNTVDDENLENPKSGKIRRRTCYECGEKGHLSSSCPNIQAADLTNSSKHVDYFTFVPTANEEAGENLENPVSGKIRRRTCYECGEKGHLSSSCPKTQAADLKNSNKLVGDLNCKQADDLTSVPIANKDANENVGNSVSGKIRRRTCYECGEKGHLSTSCPKKQELIQ